MKHGKVAHIAPGARQVPRLMTELFSYLCNNNDMHPIIVSSVFHYELEFIHPFSDGNGRIGRLWQYALLIGVHPIFEWIPLESIVRQRQDDYYAALAISDSRGDSACFVEFMLEAIVSALTDAFDELQLVPVDADTRLRFAKASLTQDFSRKDYISLFGTLSTATASRDLAHGVASDLLTKTGQRAQTRYRFNP